MVGDGSTADLNNAAWLVSFLPSFRIQILNFSSRFRVMCLMHRRLAGRGYLDNIIIPGKVSVRLNN